MSVAKSSLKSDTINNKQETKTARLVATTVNFSSVFHYQDKIKTNKMILSDRFRELIIELIVFTYYLWPYRNQLRLQENLNQTCCHLKK